MLPVELTDLGPVTDGVTGEHWDAEVLRDQIRRRAAGFAARGIGPGGRVLLLHGNTPGFLADLFAVWACGAAAACADALLGPADLASLTDDLRPDLVVVAEEPSDRLAPVLAGQTVVRSGTVADAATWQPPTAVAPDDPALILFTSGSTGLPKGVVHSFRTLVSKWTGLRHHVPLEVCATTLCALPTHFGHGLICNALYPLVHGCHLVILPRLDLRSAARLPEVLDAHEVTFLSSVPAMWRLVLALAPPPARRTLRQVHIGSAPLSAELWHQVRDWTGTRRVWNTYGITETGSWVAGPVDDPEPEPADGLIGGGWHSQVLIVSADADPAALARGEVAPLPAGEVGQVLLRSPDLMTGYLDRPEETAGVVQGPWLSTGDLGRQDDAGRLILVGRQRNEVNKGGIKISPEEVDLVVERHPEVAEACTFRVPDELLGEDLEVAVVLRPGATTGPTEVTRWVGTQLAAAKVPRAVHVVAEIPKTARGKVNRDQVAAFCRGPG